MTSAFSDICIVYLDRLGDAVLKSGFVQTVRKLWPEASITLVCSERTADYWRLCPHLNDMRLAKSVPLNETFYARDTEKKLFDLAIALRAASDYENCHLLVEATKAVVRIGFRHAPQDHGEAYNRAFTHLVDPPTDNSEHVSDTPYRLLKEPLGLNDSLTIDRRSYSGE